MRVFSADVFAALIIIIGVVGVMVLVGQYYSVPPAYRGAL